MGDEEKFKIIKSYVKSKLQQSAFSKASFIGILIKNSKAYRQFYSGDVFVNRENDSWIIRRSDG